MTPTKTKTEGRRNPARFAGMCLALLKKNVGARNLATANGDLTSLVLLAIIARGSAVNASREVLARIKEVFVDWNELRVTRAGQIAFYLTDIRDARAKAHTMTDVLANIFENTHDLHLHFLDGVSAEEARDYLRGLGGLSDGMVNEVILAGRAFFHLAADTDVVRVARRLDIIGRNTTPGGFERYIVELLGEERAYQVTFLLKDLSESTCHVRGQLCEECPLSKTCPSSRTRD